MTSRFLKLCLAGLLAPIAGEAQRRPFTQVYLSFDIAVQQIIGGSLIDGVDVLQQARRPVASLSVGARYQTRIGTVFGGAVGVGLARGNLDLRDPSRALEVAYHNRWQRHWALDLGQAVGPGRRTLVNAWLSEVTRDFQVDIASGSRRFAQRDEQGLLRYGIGVEHQVHPGIGIRGAVGSSRADFGGRPTNIVPDRPVDWQLGVTFGSRR